MDDGVPLAYVLGGDEGAGDRLLAEVVARLQAEGVPLAGVVQENPAADPGRPCHMDLAVIGSGERIRISQDLGPLSTGCRLDVEGLETAVARVEASLPRLRPQLLVLNKFGKHEAEGRGFRPLIGRALAEGLPVLTGVNRDNLAALEAFAGGLATELPADAETILAWCWAVVED